MSRMLRPRGLEGRALLDYILSRCRPDGGCLIWTLGTGRGYARVKYHGSMRQAARVVYELAHGPVSVDETVKQTCGRHDCLQPRHLTLQPIPYWEAAGAAKRATTQCPRGHEYTADNLIHRSNGRRECRICNRERVRAIRAQQRAEAQR